MRIPASHHSRRPAFTLIECLVYLGLVVVIMGFTFTAFYHAWDNHRELRRNTEQIALALKAGERWRADIRDATGLPESVEKPGVTALHIPHAGQEVIYAFRHNAVLRRANAEAAWQPVLQNVKSSRMFPEKRGAVRSWRWELELDSPQKAVRVRPLFSFQAVPGLFELVEANP